MTKSGWFYWVAGIALVTAFGHAGWRTAVSLDDGPAPPHYAHMTLAERAAEYRALEAEVKKSGRITPERYFQIYARLEKLDQAIYRASKEEQTLDPRIARSSMLESSRLSFLKRDWTNSRDEEWRLDRTLTMEQVDSARTAAGLDEIHMRPRGPMDPFLPMAWVLFYFSAVLFTLCHFGIRIEKMGGCWWHEAMPLVGDYRFYAWALIWFVGVFKYPAEINVIERAKLLTQRTYRFATLLLSSAISMAGAGCAAKRVNIDPDVRPDNPGHTLVITANTVTWPSYIGANGAVFHAGPVQQSDVTVTAKNGVYAGLWHSAPVDRTDADPNFGREIDGSLGWNGSAGKFGLGADLTWIGVTPLAHYRGDVLQFSGSVSRKIGRGFGLSSSVHLFTPTRGETPRRGIFFREGVNWSRERGRLSFSASGEVFHDSGAFGFARGWFSRGAATLGWRANSHWKIGLPIRWNAPLSATTDGRRKELQGGLIVSWQP